MKRLLIALALLCSFSSSQAVVISTSAGDFDVTVVNGNFTALQPALEAQPWWNDPVLATEFVLLTQDVFAPGLTGPVFAVDVNAVGGNVTSYVGQRWQEPSDTVLNFSGSLTGGFDFAVARVVPANSVDEPGALALLGLSVLCAGLAARRHRNRKPTPI